MLLLYNAFFTILNNIYKWIFLKEHEMNMFSQTKSKNDYKIMEMVGIVDRF